MRRLRPGAPRASRGRSGLKPEYGTVPDCPGGLLKISREALSKSIRDLSRPSFQTCLRRADAALPPASMQASGIGCLFQTRLCDHWRVMRFRGGASLRRAETLLESKLPARQARANACDSCHFVIPAEAGIWQGRAWMPGNFAVSPVCGLAAGACLLSLPRSGNGWSELLDSGFRRNDGGTKKHLSSRIKMITFTAALKGSPEPACRRQVNPCGNLSRPFVPDLPAAGRRASITCIHAGEGTRAIAQPRLAARSRTGVIARLLDSGRRLCLPRGNPDSIRASLSKPEQ